MKHLSCRRSARLLAVMVAALGLLQTQAGGGELTDSLIDSLTDALRSDDPTQAYVVRSGLGHSIGDGVGYDSGFSNFSNFIPLIEVAEQRLLFADVHLLMNNRSAVGGNLGLGHRVYDADANRTWGVFAWYDFRETRENWFHQMTIGFESLGEYLDIRSNIYIPDVGDDRLPNPDRNHFSGNQLIIADEAAMTAVDLEAGTSLVTFGDIVTRSYAGGYFLRATGSPDTWGWRHRTELEWTDRMWVNFGIQDDDLFGRTITVGITIHSLQAVPSSHAAPPWPPFDSMSRPDTPSDPSHVAGRLSEPTRRFRNIMIHRQERVAADPATGALLSFLHVVPGGSGNGSIEAPFGEFAEAMADSRASGSLVYTPEGGSFFTGDLELVSGTELVSSANQYRVATQGGPRLLPRSGFAPATVLNGNITLAAKTRVDGFEINGQLTGDAVEDLTLVRNLISPATEPAGILLTSIENSGNPIVISENTITGGDIGISATGTTLDLELSENSVLDAAIQAIQIEASGVAASASTWIVTGNSLSGTNLGIGTEATFTNSGTGSVLLILTRNSSSNALPDDLINFDLLNTGGGTFTLQPFGSNTGEVDSSDESVVIP